MCNRTTAFAVAALLMAAGPAHALRIVTQYAAPGQLIPSIGEATEPAVSAVGGGDLETIVRAAADTWEALIPDAHTLTLRFGWYPTTGISNSAYHIAGASIGSPLREISGSIAFNSADATFPMYLDPTPLVNNEFVFEGRAFEDLGTGQIETARHFRATTGLASRKNDVYSAALHEIGHALGLTQLASYESETADGDIDLTIPEFEGAAIPVIGSHLKLNGPLLSYKARDVGQRRGITQADLLAVCQISGFQDCLTDLAPAQYAGDINGDGAVNAADYTVWRDAFSDGSVASSTAYDTWSDSYGTTFATAATLQGDFNADGLFNAADYTVWRDAIQASDLRADADTDGSITADDWSVWASRYGTGSPVPLAGVPEPGTATLLLVLGALTCYRR